MLRITISSPPGHATVVLEGRLAGAWVGELGACWYHLIATHDARSVEVDLNGVTFVDAAGKVLLRSMHARGARLAATDLVTRTILEEDT